MVHNYEIDGMSCDGCRAKVEEALNSLEGISATVTLDPAQAIVSMQHHIPLATLQEALAQVGNYTISEHNAETVIANHDRHETARSQNSSKGVYYCPMHCEGDKTYDKPGSCPVCGMNLEKLPQLAASKFTCPMHPEIIKDAPGPCPICGMNLVPVAPNNDKADKTYLDLLRKMKIAVACTIPVFIIAMAEMWHGNPLTRLMPVASWNWVQLALSIPVLFYSGWMFFQRAYRSVITWKLNMFTLIGIGTGMAFLFSVIAMLAPAAFPEEFKSDHGTIHLYFEAAAVIITLVLLGQLMEARAHGRTNDAIKELMKLAPVDAVLVKDGSETTISISDIVKGDILRVKPGDKIPVDGTISEGMATIDEAMITGEPIPVEKNIGDKVTSGTVNGNTTFLMEAEKVGSETLLARIIEMVNTASRSKAPIQKLADKVSGYFVPAVIIIAIITFFAWAKFGPDPALVYGFVNAVAVLIIACPCALGLATPMSVMVGVGKGAQLGILIKNAEALEKMSKVDVLITDKTGTLTEGKPSVEKITGVGIDEPELIRVAASLNQNSGHPLAQAIVNFAKDKSIPFATVSDFRNESGKGVTGKIDGKTIAIGNMKLLDLAGITASQEIAQEVRSHQKAGKTVSYLAIAGEVKGYVVISDGIKATSHQAIQELHQEQIKVMMLTGDNTDTAKAVAAELGIDTFRADCLPEDKLEEIQRLQQKGKIVAMAGDGINDAPALARADVGIAMGTGTDVAIESAQITLVKGDLLGILKARNLSHSVMRNIKQNLFFAFIYNILGIPVAAGLLYPSFGLLLSPMIAALAMSFSSISVIANALRLRTITFKTN